MSVIEVSVPQENVNDDAVTINRWLVEDGERVEKGQDLVEVETSKADFAIPAPGSGFVRHLAKAGADVPVGAAICLIGTEEETRNAGGETRNAKHETRNEEGETRNAKRETRNEGPVVAVNGMAAGEGPAIGEVAARFSAQAAALIKEHKVDAGEFKGKGLVRGDDVLEFLGKKVKAVAAVEKATVAKAENSGERVRGGPQPSIGVAVRVEKLARAKQMEVRYLRSSYDNAIPSTVCVTARSYRKAGGAGAGESFSSVVLFEVGRLLRKYPVFNAFYAEGHCHFYEEVNVGFAIDVGEGLKVAVIRDADLKGLAAVQEEQREVVVACLSGELRPESLSGGTFTVTDLSGEGVSTFVPLINQGQSAILGIGAVSEGGTYELILTFDHQLAEGRMAALFLKELRHRLEAHEQAAAGDMVVVEAVSEVGEILCWRCGTGVKDLPGGHFMLTGYPRSGKVAEPICTVCVQDF